MIVGLDRLLELVNDPAVKLVENLGERDRLEPEGTGFDLRVGKLFALTGDSGSLGVTERSTPEVRLLAEVGATTPITVACAPHESYLLQTCETINMPAEYVGLLQPRSTLFRSGQILSYSQINPGYAGTLTLLLYNATDVPFFIEMGARFCHLLVAEVAGLTTPYRGQWQGGRVWTGVERQR